jgi:hypothetical protein
MKTKNLIRAVFAAALLSMFMLGTAAADAITYHISVNTSSIGTVNGYLDFQFNPGGLDTQLAGAQVLNFATDGFLLNSPAPAPTGDVTGDLPGTLAFDNQSAFNDYFQHFTFGNSVAFDLLLNGPALTSPNGTSSSGTTFGFAVYADDAMTPLLTSDPSGQVLTVDVNLDGTTTPRLLGLDDSGAPYANATTPVPEPASMVLLASGALGVLARRKRK